MRDRDVAGGGLRGAVAVRHREADAIHPAVAPALAFGTEGERAGARDGDVSHRVAVAVAIRVLRFVAEDGGDGAPGIEVHAPAARVAGAGAVREPERAHGV